MFVFKIPTSLAGRLTLYYAAAFLLFLSASYLLLFWSIGAVLDNKMDEDLSEDIAEFSHVLWQSGVEGVISDMEREVLGGEIHSVFLLLYRSDGTLIHSTDLTFWPNVLLSSNLISKWFKGALQKQLLTLDVPEHDSATRVVYSWLSSEYMMVIGESYEERDDIMELLTIVIAVVFLITLPLASLLVWLLTQRSIAGIKSVSRAALDIKSGDLDRRVNAAGQAIEVQTLADTFDAMADRIQDLIGNMREMTDNIAHDLRSPISRVRLLCESALQSPVEDKQFRQVAADSIAECDRLIKMINTSLDVAETEAGVGMRSRGEINMKSLTADACELFEAVAEEKGISMTAELEVQCCLIGDVTSIQRMVANVLDNAIKYTSRGGSIHIVLKLNRSVMELMVTDSGVGVDNKDYEKIFHRFYRVDPSRSSSGCGLGLSYARAVARAHDGDITLSSKKGSCTTFTITMPCMPNSVNTEELKVA